MFILCSLESAWWNSNWTFIARSYGWGATTEKRI